MEAGADFQQRADAAAEPGRADGRLGDPAEDLQQRDLPAPLRPMMPNTSPCWHLEADVLQGPEVLRLRPARAAATNDWGRGRPHQVVP